MASQQSSADLDCVEEKVSVAVEEKARAATVRSPWIMAELTLWTFRVTSAS